MQDSRIQCCNSYYLQARTAAVMTHDLRTDHRTARLRVSSTPVKSLFIYFLTTRFDFNPWWKSFMSFCKIKMVLSMPKDMNCLGTHAAERRRNYLVNGISSAQKISSWMHTRPRDEVKVWNVLLIIFSPFHFQITFIDDTTFDVIQILSKQLFDLRQNYHEQLLNFCF